MKKRVQGRIDTTLRLAELAIFSLFQFLHAFYERIFPFSPTCTSSSPLFLLLHLPPAIPRLDTLFAFQSPTVSTSLLHIGCGQIPSVYCLTMKQHYTTREICSIMSLYEVSFSAEEISSLFLFNKFRILQGDCRVVVTGFVQFLTLCG